MSDIIEQAEEAQKTPVKKKVTKRRTAKKTATKKAPSRKKVTKKVTKKVAKKAPVKKAAAKKPGTKKDGTRGRRGKYDGMVVKKLVDTNPHRESGAAYQSWALLKNGQTIEQFVEAGGDPKVLYWAIYKGTIEMVDKK